MFLVQCSTGSKFKVKDYSSLKLENGLEILLFKDQQLPYTTLKMVVGVGDVHDPEGLSGLNTMVVSLLDKGTSTKSATQIADTLDQMGVYFSASSSKDFTSISSGGLSKYRNEILKEFSELVLTPKFSNKEVTRQKKQFKAQLSKVSDDPKSLIGVASQAIIYGDHSYGKNASPKYSSLKNMNGILVRAHYKKYFAPNNAKMAIVGNFDQAYIDEVKAAFSKWQGGATPKVVNSVQLPVEKQQVVLVNKPGTKQTQVRFMHEGIKKNNPDYIKLKVANLIVGGGFSARLMSEVRVKRGLSYGAYSGFAANKFGGTFNVSTFSRHDKLGELIKVTLDTLKNFVEGGVTKEELNTAKAQVRGQFPILIETPEKLADNILILSQYGIDRKYLDSYISEINSLSLSEANKLIKKYYHPDKMKIVLVSTESEIKDQLKGFDYEKVNYKSILK